MSEILVTGAVTATISRMHACSGTTADYTVTLPPVAGNDGKSIGFRMVPGLTKLVTLDGNASETIDGLTTRVMWAGEAAILYCDGSNWFKIVGKSIPMQCAMFLSAGQTGIVTATVTKANLDTVASDNTGMMGDTTNKRINIKRAGIYFVSGQAQFNTSAAAGRIITQLRKNAAQIATAEQLAYQAGFSSSVANSILPWAVSDHVELAGYQTSGVDAVLYGDTTLATTGCQLNVIEQPSW